MAGTTTVMRAVLVTAMALASVPETSVQDAVEVTTGAGTGCPCGEGGAGACCLGDVRAWWWWGCGDGA